MNNNICPRCGTENESQYTFCKNCGTSLSANQSTTENNTYSANTTFQENTFNNHINFDGITVEEMSLFVGKKAPKIIPKFTNMEITGSKVSWCWPVAILCLIFGAPGAALWFFYRKMYKHAVIFTLIGAFLTIISSIVTGIINPDFTELFKYILITGDISSIFNAFTGANQTQMLIYTAFTLFNDIIDIIILILCGVFGLHMYKQHSIEKIHAFKSYQSDKPYYKLGLTAIGGVSGGMLTLGIIIMILTANISSVLSTLINNL